MTGIRVRDAATLQERVVVPESPGGPLALPLAFSPDSRFLLFKYLNQIPRILNLTTGESWPVFSAKGTDINFGYSDWAPDGSFIVMQGFNYSRTWRAFEGVTYDAVTKLIAGKK